MKSVLLSGFAIAVCFLTANPHTSDATPDPLISCTVKPRYVVDGDTLWGVCNGQPLKIRLACIDAPELDQPYGIASRDYLRSRLAEVNGSIEIKPVDRDRYGRTVAELYSPSGSLIQLQQVTDGWAWANTPYQPVCSQWNAIVQGEQQAQSHHRGLWTADPVAPWLFRQRSLK